MLCLGIDCAGKTAGAALLQDNRLLYEASLETGLTHSETLLEMIDTAFRAAGCTLQQVDLIGVCAGPGSFTGLRIGLALVKGLAASGSIPCAGVSTLQALALSYPHEGSILTALDARRGEVYWAVFDRDGNRLCEDSVGPAKQAAEFAASCPGPLLVVGDGAGLCRKYLSEGSCTLPLLHGSRASGVALAALRAQQQGLAVPQQQLLPNYLRLSQAERERAAREAAKG